MFKVLFIFFTSCFLNLNAYAELKQLRCFDLMDEGGSEWNPGCVDGKKSREMLFIVDTDHFEKSEPMYEFRLIYACNERVTVPVSYQLPMKVTSTTLGFAAPARNPWFSIDRESLIGVQDGTVLKCGLEDVERENKI